MSLEPRDPHLRASDADRDAVGELLREAYAEGRLGADEFSDRLDAALAARTHGDLEPLTRDVPVPRLARPRTGDEARTADVEPREDRPGLRVAWGAWATATLVNLVIWAAVSASAEDWAYFWPMWVAGPWGAVLLARTLFGRFPVRPGVS